MIPFESEQWMTRFEKNVEYNLADTSVPALAVKDLETNFQDLFLDYGNIDGSDRICALIEELYEPVNRDKRTVLPTLGSSQANFLVMESILKPEDEVIVFEPDYKQFERVARKFGCTTKTIQLDNQGQFDPAELEKAISQKTKLICFSSPNNPMGTVFDEEHRNFLKRMAEENEILILSDEVYRLDEPSFSDLTEQAISTGSLSKIYGAAGLRFGWIRASEPLINGFKFDKDYHFISTGPFIEAMAEKVLGQQDGLKEKARKHLAENRKIFNEWIAEHSQYRSSADQHGNSILIALPQQDDQEICEQLAREGVLLVPGSFFGKKGTARLGLGAQPEFFKKGLQNLDKKLSKFQPKNSEGMI